VGLPSLRWRKQTMVFRRNVIGAKPPPIGWRNMHPLYDYAEREQAMIQRDQLELLLAAVAGAGLGGVAGIVLGHEELGTLIWALVGAVVVSGVVYFYWSFRRH